MFGKLKDRTKWGSVTRIFSVRYRQMLMPSAVILCLLANLSLAAQKFPQGDVSPILSEPPEVRSPFVLRALNDPLTGRGAFSFAGREVPPTIRTSPGAKIKMEYVNQMSRTSHETCVDGRCKNMTNLHFHGLHVSPDAPQDDVISMMAMPGESLHYVVDVPDDQPPGLYWYHTHPHGESYQQSLDGMSGVIVVDGIERYVPEVRSMKERILILRDAELQQDDPSSTALKRRVQLSSSKCGAADGDPARVFTVNGDVRPRIGIAPGEKQFWRIVNASPDLYADLVVDSQQMIVVAFDGMPLAFHDPTHRSEKVEHVLLAPAGRVEFIVTGPKAGSKAAIRSRCVDTGADGDPNPAMVLADLDEDVRSSAHPIYSKVDGPAAVYRPLSSGTIQALEDEEPKFVVKFTEDKNGFYINDKKYATTDPPMTTVRIGNFVHWRVTNQTNEMHPFHIHQVHFLVYEEDGKKVKRPEWMDTINVAPEGSVDLVMDFTDPIIRGMSLFHCHLLKHEDKGMMAKILFQ
jgi:suppressor of ftsI